MIEKYYQEKNRILIALSLVVFGIVARLTFYQFLPNTPSIYITINGVTQNMFMMDLFFVVAVISILSGILLGGYYTFIVPLSVLMITDLIIGNSLILLFTWSGFILLATIAYFIKQRKGLSIKSAPTLIGGSIIGVLIYDIWTNFGCWIGWYPKTIAGLASCYTFALPFMFWHILSTTIALTIIILPIAYLKEHKNFKLDFKVKPWEKKSALITSTILMSLALITIIF
jgi:hypothetical protein